MITFNKYQQIYKAINADFLIDCLQLMSLQIKFINHVMSQNKQKKGNKKNTKKGVRNFNMGLDATNQQDDLPPVVSSVINDDEDFIVCKSKPIISNVTILGTNMQQSNKQAQKQVKQHMNTSIKQSQIQSLPPVISIVQEHQKQNENKQQKQNNQNQLLNKVQETNQNLLEQQQKKDVKVSLQEQKISNQIENKIVYSKQQQIKNSQITVQADQPVQQETEINFQTKKQKKNINKDKKKSKIQKKTKVQNLAQQFQQFNDQNQVQTQVKSIQNRQKHNEQNNELKNQSKDQNNQQLQNVINKQAQLEKQKIYQVRLQAKQIDMNINECQRSNQTKTNQNQQFQVVTNQENKGQSQLLEQKRLQIYELQNQQTKIANDFQEGYKKQANDDVPKFDQMRETIQTNGNGHKQPSNHIQNEEITNKPASQIFSNNQNQKKQYKKQDKKQNKKQDKKQDKKKGKANQKAPTGNNKQKKKTKANKYDFSNDNQQIDISKPEASKIEIQQKSEIKKQQLDEQFFNDQSKIQQDQTVQKQASNQQISTDQNKNDTQAADISFKNQEQGFDKKQQKIEQTIQRSLCLQIQVLQDESMQQKQENVFKISKNKQTKKKQKTKNPQSKTKHKNLVMEQEIIEENTIILPEKKHMQKDMQGQVKQDSFNQQKSINTINNNKIQSTETKYKENQRIQLQIDKQVNQNQQEYKQAIQLSKTVDNLIKPSREQKRQINQQKQNAGNIQVIQQQVQKEHEIFALMSARDGEQKQKQAYKVKDDSKRTPEQKQSLVINTINRNAQHDKEQNFAVKKKITKKKGAKKTKAIQMFSLQVEDDIAVQQIKMEQNNKIDISQSAIQPKQVQPKKEHKQQINQNFHQVKQQLELVPQIIKIEDKQNQMQQDSFIHQRTIEKQAQNNRNLLTNSNIQNRIEQEKTTNVQDNYQFRIKKQTGKFTKKKEKQKKDVKKKVQMTQIYKQQISQNTIVREYQKQQCSHEKAPTLQHTVDQTQYQNVHQIKNDNTSLNNINEENTKTHDERKNQMKQNSSISKKAIVEELVSMVSQTNRKNLGHLKERLLMMKQDIRSSLVHRQQIHGLNKAPISQIQYEYIVEQNIKLKTQLNKSN